MAALKGDGLLAKPDCRPFLQQTGFGRVKGTQVNDIKLVETDIQLGRSDNNYKALGLAVEYLMRGKAFSDQKFGSFSSVLIGQINRGHYVLARRDNRTVGFAGYARCQQAVADRWLSGGAEPTSAECTGGPCVIINAWMADDVRVSLALKKWFVTSIPDGTSMLAKRFYKDGTMRVVDLRRTLGAWRPR